MYKPLRSLPVAVTMFVLGLVLLLVGVPSLATTAHAADERHSRAIIPPKATVAPAPDDSEIIIDQIRTDTYPRMSTRFSLRPISGPPPGYLEPGDVNLVSDGTFHAVQEVHTVGRVPTTGVGTYEVTWISFSGIEPGGIVSGRIAVSVNNLSLIHI